MFDKSLEHIFLYVKKPRKKKFEVVIAIKVTVKKLAKNMATGRLTNI